MPYLPPIFLLSFSYLLPASFRFLSRYHSDTISISLTYHPILSPYFPACQVFGVSSPSKYSSIASTKSSILCNLCSLAPNRIRVFLLWFYHSACHAEYPCVPLGSKCSAISLRVKNYKKMRFCLHIRKFYCTFALANQNLSAYEKSILISTESVLV